MKTRYSPGLLLGLIASVLLAGCTSWKPVEQFEGWTLYVQDGQEVETAAFRDSIEPAIDAVEHVLGLFRQRVRVHAWDGGVQMVRGNQGRIEHGEHAGIEEVPGIGPARVRAFHSRDDGSPFSQSGVFVGTSDPGTMVHELVHARIAEEAHEMPLWFEEGFASLLGDGALYEGHWYVDGLACWPWHELQDEDIGDGELARLLSLTPSQDHSVRENVLAHFVGWAIAFDLYREQGNLDWRAMLDRFHRAKDPVAEARRRLKNSLNEETVAAWMSRLHDESPGIRIATAKGTWKLRSHRVMVELMRSLGEEQDDEVRTALAINLMATAGQMRVYWRRERRMWRLVMPVLRDALLGDPIEQEALRKLYEHYKGARYRGAEAQTLEPLARFWRE